MRNVYRCLIVALFLCALPKASFAQGSIAGSVRDTSGAVLPGVTVEASSPALIEKVRTVVSDGAGQYRIVDLPPGTYDVVFSLAGFRTVRREGVLIQGDFAAQINGELQVGALEESITVTGESPTVDVVNNRQQFVANRDILDAIPTPIRNTPLRALLLPGTSVTPFVLGQYTMSVHGSNSSDTVISVDGMRVNNLCGSGQYSGFYMNDAAIEEISFTTGAESAEMQNGGLRINSIPKDGGNTFSGSFFAYGAKSGLQSDNRNDDTRPFIPDQPGLAYVWQINPSFGGPIVRNKLWFYFTYKYEDSKTYIAGVEFADGSPAYRQSMGNYTGVGRITWQATERDKVRFYIDRQFNGEFFNGFNTYPTTTPEASTDAFGRGWVTQLKWTQTTTNRLLLEGGLTYYNQPYEQNPRPTVGPRDLPMRELATGLLTGSNGHTIPSYTSWTKSYSSMASASYITGSHAIKTGMTMNWGTNSRTFTQNYEINQLVFLGGRPTAVVVSNGPTEARQKVNADFGFYAQDAWTINRLTLNVGGRYDYFNAEVPAQSAPAGVWIADRDFPAIENVPNWHDWSVRLAGSYDLFGTGRTALKANASKYIASQAAGYAANFNGMTYATQTRGWVDFDGNRTVLDANGNLQRNEVLGGTSNFGGVTSRPDPDLKRGYNWEYGVSVQHQVVPRLSVNVGYHRRNFYNLDVNDNLNLSVDDWTPFNVTVPDDPRLPSAGQTITMYTLNPNKRGVATDTIRTYSSSNTSVYNGFEISANARFSRALFFGGVTTDRRATTSCDERDNPNDLRFCDSVPPFRTSFKLSGAYQLPWDFQVSGAFLASPGPSVSANYTVDAAIAGRPILGSTGGDTTIGVNLIEPNTVFLDYRKQLDLRFSKGFRFDRYRVQVFADLFNALNAGTVVRVNTAYSSNAATNVWMRPLTLMDGRYVRFGMQMNF